MSGMLYDGGCVFRNGFWRNSFWRNSFHQSNNRPGFSVPSVWLCARGPVCSAGHQLCTRCHRAFWKGQTDGLVQAAQAEPPDKGFQANQPSLVKIEERTPEFDEATGRFTATFGGQVTIERVFRVDNPTLSDMFELCRTRMAREIKPTEESIMFHGSDRSAVGSIIRSGFDIRYSGKNAEALGPGIYLAEHASYSHGFAVEDYGGNLCMIVARVLAGRRPETGLKAAKRGARQQEGPGYYDSNFGGNVLAVRREQQALPVYVIYYHTRT